MLSIKPGAPCLVKEPNTPFSYTNEKNCVIFIRVHHFIQIFTLFHFVLFLDLVNVFEVFLPQLLLYPNPSDPLNGEAAALLMRDKAAYEQRVKGIW